MSIFQVNFETPTNITAFTDTAMGATADGIKSSSAVVYSVLINNTANASPVYVKLYNLASGSTTIGTTPPDEIIYIPSSTTVTHFLYSANAPGKTFGTALTAACVTTGGTSGTTPPSSSVSVTINYM